MEIAVPSTVHPESNGRDPKRRKISPSSSSSLLPPRWGSATVHQLYSSNLIAALRRSPSRAVLSSRLIRDAADRVLAASAGGRTRWSRAILRRRSHRLRSIRRKPPHPPPVVGRGTPAAASTVEGKVRALGRLVPGCGRLGLGRLLEETSDYVAALQMQVRSLGAIFDAIAAVASVSQS